MNKLLNFSAFSRIGITLVLAVLFAFTTIGAGEVSAATGGVLKNMFPPGNNGTAQGVGMIDGHDGNKYVFLTPRDNGGTELTEGEEIIFELGNGRMVDGVTQESDNPIGEAASEDLVDSTTELQEGKKGLNAVDVKTLSRDGGESTLEWVAEYVLGREMVMPGDNALCIDGAKIVTDRDSGRSTGHDDDCDGIPEERGDRVIQIIKGNGNTGHINVLRFAGGGHGGHDGDFITWEEILGWFETCTREHDEITDSVLVCIQEALSAAVIPLFQDQTTKAAVIPMFQDQTERGVVIPMFKNQSTRAAVIPMFQDQSNQRRGIIGDFVVSSDR